MNFSTSPVIGTIAIQPRHGLGGALLPLEADDSSLEALLTSLVQSASHAEGRGDSPVHLVASGRLSRFSFGEESDSELIRADLARLVEDLEAEYDRLAMA